MQFPTPGKTSFEDCSLHRPVPAFSDFRQKSCFVFPDEADQRLIAGVFMSGCPKNHFGEDGSQVHAFGGEKVVKFAAVGGVSLGADNAVAFQPAEAVGQDVGGDVLVGGEELLESAVTANHHVADDEQGPAISQHFDGSV